MHCSRRLAPCLAVLIASAASPAPARTWTDSTGKYTLDAELIGFDDDSVVLQRASDHHLGEIARDKLSKKDQQYLESKEAQESTERLLGAKQLWTGADGLKVEGRIVDFLQKDITLHRRRSRLYVNDRPYKNLPPIYQKIVWRVVEHFEGVEINQEIDLNRWVAQQRHKPRTFHCEGVVLELDNGDEYAVPFFLFSQDDLAVLQPGYQEWKSAESDYEAREDVATRLQALAAARQQDKQVDRQIARMQLAMQAVVAGVASLWEVTLYPAAGTPGAPIWAVYPGRDSRAAAQAALAANPGYVMGPVRKVSY